MWADSLGVKTEIIATDNYRSVMDKNNWDIYMVIWGADVVDPDNFLGELFYSGKDTNYGKFSSQTYDALIDEAAAGKTPKERQELYIKAEKMLCEDYIALVPLYTVKNWKR
jgi:oligopeptide transport system substrate-binding protein